MSGTLSKHGALSGQVFSNLYFYSCTTVGVIVFFMDPVFFLSHIIVSHIYAYVGSIALLDYDEKIQSLY